MLIPHLLTVVQFPGWNWRIIDSSAGSMYQMLANIKKIMARLAIHQTNPISTSSSQAVILFFCLARHPLQPPGPQHPIVLSPISTLTLDSPLSSQPLDLHRGPGPPSPPSTGSPPTYWQTERVTHHNFTPRFGTDRQSPIDLSTIHLSVISIP